MGSAAPDPSGRITLGHIFDASGLTDLDDVAVIRHTYTAGGLESARDLVPAKLLEYTRWQAHNNKLGKTPPGLWLTFMADGARRSRFLTAYESRGEVPANNTDALRYFDLHPSDVMSGLADRLVVEWSRDAVNWAKSGRLAAAFPVMEIADPNAVPFPGFDRVLLTYDELQAVVTDSRYAAWRTALGSVQGIYLIADTSTGHLYIGKADGRERILGRWTNYAHDGHGGNVALRALAGDDSEHARHFKFSILRVFGPSAVAAEVDEAEAHYKRALLTREFGLNRN